ncbi:MAG: hypothetical protein AAF078_08845 [Planctomycetota bacterium]
MEAAADRAAVEAVALWTLGLKESRERYGMMWQELAHESYVLRRRIEVFETPPTQERIEQARAAVIDLGERAESMRQALHEAIATGDSLEIDAAYSKFNVARFRAKVDSNPDDAFLEAVERPAQAHEVEAFRELIESYDRAAHSLRTISSFRDAIARRNPPHGVDQALTRLTALLERVTRVPEAGEFGVIERREVRPGREPGEWYVFWYAEGETHVALASVQLRALNFRRPYHQLLMEEVPIVTGGFSEILIELHVGNFDVGLRFSDGLPKGQDVMRRAAVELINVEALRALTVETRPELLDAAQE